MQVRAKHLYIYSSMWLGCAMDQSLLSQLTLVTSGRTLVSHNLSRLSVPDMWCKHIYVWWAMLWDVRSKKAGTQTGRNTEPALPSLRLMPCVGSPISYPPLIVYAVPVLLRIDRSCESDIWARLSGLSGIWRSTRYHLRILDRTPVTSK